MAIIKCYKCDFCGSLLPDEKEYKSHTTRHKKDELKKSLRKESISNILQAGSLNEVRDYIYTGFNSFAKNKLTSLNITFTHEFYPYSRATTINGEEIKPKYYYRLSIEYEYNKTLNRVNDDNFINYLGSCGLQLINGYVSNEKSFQIDMYMIIENFPNLNTSIKNVTLLKEDLLIRQQNKISDLALTIRSMESYNTICDKILSINSDIETLNKLKEKALTTLRGIITEKMNEKMSCFSVEESDIEMQLNELRLNLKKNLPHININSLGAIHVN